jgi:hypothetical protein
MMTVWQPPAQLHPPADLRPADGDAVIISEECDLAVGDSLLGACGTGRSFTAAAGHRRHITIVFSESFFAPLEVTVVGGIQSSLPSVRYEDYGKIEYVLSCSRTGTTARASRGVPGPISLSESTGALSMLTTLTYYLAFVRPRWAQRK